MSAKTGDPPAPVEPAGPAQVDDPSAAPEAAGAAEPALPSATPPDEPAPDAPRAGLPAQLLGLSKGQVEAKLGELRFAKTGWATTAAEPELQLQLRGGRCVRVRGPVPEDMDCADVATWLGYGPGAYPLRRADHCQWPGISAKHRLAEGVAGQYVPATREFEIWLRD